LCGVDADACVPQVKGNTIIAEDGSTAEADVIVFATGEH
jgi:hypothetical protein